MLEKNLKRRVENLDNLRCLAMIMIILLHIINHGGVMSSLKSQECAIRIPVSLLHFASCCSVNVFMLLSGFFGCQVKFRYSRIVMLYIQTFFWSCALAILIHLLIPQFPISIPLYKYVPLLTVYYWFFTSYFIVFFAMPFMNFIVCTMDKTLLRITIISFFILFCVLTGNNAIGFHFYRGRDAFMLNAGFSPLWLGYVYLFGAFLAKHGFSSLLPDNLTKWMEQISLVEELKKKHWVWTWGGYFFTMIVGFIHFTINSHLGFLRKLYSANNSYNDPYILIMAIFLFEAFRRTKFPSWLNYLGGLCAPYTFGVILIHGQYDCWLLLKDSFSFIGEYGAGMHIPMIIACSLGIFVVCCAMDWLRCLLFRTLHIKPIVQKILREI